MSTVTARLEPLTLPTYPVGEPEKNPVFFERRVYQGSSGKVYPVPFVDKVHDEPRPVAYRAARLENEHVRLVLLPEIGGRILVAQDKTNRDYDFFYRPDVIKPALVGLAGPWISGGVEFNWPQHHRPGTFMPADVSIEEEPDGARTVWMSEHDPLNRMKGMHGLRLRPGSSLVEARVRLFNRTPLTQTFLWWANVAVRVHDRYQSFFPADVTYVADHAVRAMSSFPVARNPYYGVAYQHRSGANDLTWWRNIPVPTSYMVCETGFDFFGGYDHEAQGGFVHVADRHVAPGKKQWTWGNHAFGRAWERELTDVGGPYIELMAGVYTDNQPDFSYLLPYETRTFSQFWWPIQKVGPVQNASERAAIRLVAGEDRRLDLAVLVPAPLPRARIRLLESDRTLLETRADLAPGQPWRRQDLVFRSDRPSALELVVEDESGRRVIAYRPVDADARPRARTVAKEPPAPADVKGTDELFLIGEHLEQYRHPTRAPEPYWREALRRDPEDARSNLALGRRLLRQGRLAPADAHLQAAVRRLTERHPNPVTGEAHYYLGLVRRFQHRFEEAYPLLFKATWNYEWRGAAYYELAALECRRGDFGRALDHLKAAIAANGENGKARVLKSIVLRRLGADAEAAAELRTVLAADPLDHWAAHEEARRTGRFEGFLERSRNDAQTVLDLVFDYADAGFFAEGADLIRRHHASPAAAAAVPNPLGRSQATRYALAWLLARQGAADEAARELVTARKQPPDWFFPSRLHEQQVLEWALSQPGNDPLAAYALGNLCYDARRHEEAIAWWERSVAGGAGFATVHRNLGLAYWNVRRDGPKARASYVRALELGPGESRLMYEFDQLCKKLNEPVAARLAFMEAHREAVCRRDDAAVELAALLNLSGRPEGALRLLEARRFHPWEGGEGATLRQYAVARILIGRRALAQDRAAEALDSFREALQQPKNLGEARHFLQAEADANYWLGRALRALGREAEARAHFERSAAESGDFRDMMVAEHSPLSYYRGLSLRELGRTEEAQELFAALGQFAKRKLGEPPAIDYFATSLPNLLVFDENLKEQRAAEARLLAALACHGLGDRDGARAHLNRMLAFTNADQHAVDLSAELQSAHDGALDDSTKPVPAA